MAKQTGATAIPKGFYPRVDTYVSAGCLSHHSVRIDRSEKQGSRRSMVFLSLGQA